MEMTDDVNGSCREPISQGQTRIIIVKDGGKLFPFRIPYYHCKHKQNTTLKIHLSETMQPHKLYLGMNGSSSLPLLTPFDKPSRAEIRHYQPIHPLLTPISQLLLQLPKI